MGTIVDLDSARLAPGDHWTELGVISRVAPYLRKRAEELPHDSNWRDCFVKIAGILDEEAAKQRGEFEAIVASCRELNRPGGAA